ncbi:hypothetical protein [Mycolicibacterium sp. P1-18]|uniref:hypothetical protein n=1 Tax=Mycolicibacterium sp. P1-18 TaxID=2024615 RepID=UPI0015657069|nr:hypothetical protein [Mycolicibacterium sp. P1-18]
MSNDGIAAVSTDVASYDELESVGARRRPRPEVLAPGGFVHGSTLSPTKWVR